MSTEANQATERTGKQTRVKVALAASSRFFRATVAKVVREHDVELVEIENSSEAFSRIRSLHPDILLVQMEFEGFDVAATRSFLKGTPATQNTQLIVFSTSSEAGEQAIEQGADAFLEFPIESAKFKTFLEARQQSRGKKILIIDDSAVIHEYIKRILKEEPYELIHAFNGKDGLVKVQERRPDLVITDVEMPGMSGYELCAQIKNNSNIGRIPVLISSTLSKGIEIDKGFDSGADDYLVKPVDADELVNKLRTMLASELKQQREHIVVIDDSRVILSIVGNGLELQGFRVSMASCGEDGVRLAKSVKPAMVITDCEMPDINGREVTRNLRNIPEFKHVPIIMLTAKESQIEKAKARKAGVSEFVTKPFTVDKILVIVERLLAESKIIREREAMMSYMSDAAIKHAEDRARLGSSTVMNAYRDHAAILFSDICGFTSMSEKRKPEAIITLLNDYFDEMVKIISANHGTVDKFIGDAIMALFYGKSAEENAYLAVKSGHEMITKLKEINSQKSDVDDHIHIRIGINSGSVVFGDLGSKISRRDFTVIGDEVNTAQRLESKAPRDGVLISDQTYQLVQEWVAIESSAALELKGKENKLLCHVLQNVLPKTAS